MPSQSRHYQPSDRGWVTAALGSDAAIDTDKHIEVVEDGADRAVAVWVEPVAGSPMLGEVVSAPPRLDMFYAAILAVIEELVAKGYQTGVARVLDEPVVEILQRDLGDAITVTPVGTNTKTGKTAYWEINTIPADALVVLRGLV